MYGEKVEIKTGFPAGIVNGPIKVSAKFDFVKSDGSGDKAIIIELEKNGASLREVIWQPNAIGVGNIAQWDVKEFTYAGKPYSIKKDDVVTDEFATAKAMFDFNKKVTHWLHQCVGYEATLPPASTFEEYATAFATKINGTTLNQLRAKVDTKGYTKLSALYPFLSKDSDLQLKDESYTKPSSAGTQVSKIEAEDDMPF